MRKLFLILISLFFLLPAKSQLPLVMDSSAIKVRTIPAGKMDEYRSQKSFQYTIKDRAASQSFFERAWQWLWDKYYEILGRDAGNALLKILLWTFAILGVAYFIIRIVGMDAFSFFEKKNKNAGVNYEVLSENVHTINFNEAVEKAVEQKNYRLAVRLLYLQLLKKLTDKNYINWQPNKSNRQYVNELGSVSLSEPFNSLTAEFEFVWYGEMPLTRQEYDIISQEFKQFYHKV